MWRLCLDSVWLLINIIILNIFNPSPRAGTLSWWWSLCVSLTLQRPWNEVFFFWISWGVETRLRPAPVPPTFHWDRLLMCLNITCFYLRYLKRSAFRLIISYFMTSVGIVTGFTLLKNMSGRWWIKQAVMLARLHHRHSNDLFTPRGVHPLFSLHYMFFHNMLSGTQCMQCCCDYV